MLLIGAPEQLVVILLALFKDNQATKPQPEENTFLSGREGASLVT